MNSRGIDRQVGEKLSRIARILLLLALVATAMPGASARPNWSPIQPQLLALAGAQPQAQVGVIVQQMAKDGSVEKAVARLGGAVTKDLSIIGGFAARMPAGTLPELAKVTGVRWVSLDGPVVSTGQPMQLAPPASISLDATANSKPIEDNDLVPTNTYLDTLGVRSVWALGTQGQGIGVAVIDSGISRDQDFAALKTRRSFNSNSSTVNDVYGHGTHVAGIIAGNGTNSGGLYAGIAPRATLLGLKINDETGMAYESDTVSAMQWVLNNKGKFNIRVVNLSINSTVEQSYHTSPLNAAAEILWFNNIVVVVSAGNGGAGGRYNTIKAAPANDPFVITVGASDEQGTVSAKDDTIPSFSAFGTTQDGTVKPDIVAPGKNIYSVLSVYSAWKRQHPDRTVMHNEYFRLSGTSMSAPMVSGAVALMLQRQPNLTADQVKYRLLNSGSTIGASSQGGPYPYLNVYAAVMGTTTQSANTGKAASRMLWSGSNAVTWDSVNWNSVNWNSVNWNSVNWNSVNWNSVNWNSVNWAN